MAIAEMVQGRYAGLVGWRVQWPNEDGGPPEVALDLTKQQILDMEAETLEGAEIFKTILVDVPVGHSEKDGAVVLDA